LCYYFNSRDKQAPILSEEIPLKYNPKRKEEKNADIQSAGQARQEDAGV
jgi:hypothetical protein